MKIEARGVTISMLRPHWQNRCEEELKNLDEKGCKDLAKQSAHEFKRTKVRLDYKSLWSRVA